MHYLGLVSPAKHKVKLCCLEQMPLSTAVLASGDGDLLTESIMKLIEVVKMLYLIMWRSTKQSHSRHYGQNVYTMFGI